LSTPSHPSVKILLIAIGSFLFALGLMLTDELFLSMSLAFGNSILSTQYDFPLLGYVGVWQAWEIDFTILFIAFLMILTAALLPHQPVSVNHVAVEGQKRTTTRRWLTVLAVVLLIIAGIFVVRLSIKTDVNIDGVDIYISLNAYSAGGSLLSTRVVQAGADQTERSIAEGSGFNYTWVQQPLSFLPNCPSGNLVLEAVQVASPGFVLTSTNPTLPAALDKSVQTPLTFGLKAPGHSFGGTLNIYLNETLTCV
jgi:hypothetical protein